MAFKDTINKVISYFDTDEVSEVEEKRLEPNESVQQQTPEQKPVRQGQSQQEVRPTIQPRPVSQEQVRPSYQNQTRPVQERPTQMTENRDRRNYQNSSDSYSSRPNRREQMEEAVQNGKTTTTIALKYPKKYEDAQEIVDMLIENECVLIDFQFMLDAQARRCLDFIDGASKVLYGTLQKVGSSMYLLTPSNVSVDIEEMNLMNTNNSNQDFGFDFDMKRR